MKKYIIEETITQTTTTSYGVLAENEEDAIKKFQSGQYDIKGDWASNAEDGIVIFEEEER